MNGPQGIKSTLILEAVTASTGDTITSSALDTKGYSYARITVHASTQATNKKPATFTLVESDADDTNTTAVLTGGTDFTIPVPATVTNGKPYFEFGVDTRGRKRYLKLIIAPTSTQTYSAQADLYRGEAAPDTTTERNVRGFAAV